MNCQEFEARLNDLLDERAPLDFDHVKVDDALRAHGRQCVACRQALAGYRELSEAMRFRAAPRAPNDLSERIVDAVLIDQAGDYGYSSTPSVEIVTPRRSDLSSSPRRAMWSTTAITSIAAAALVGVLLAGVAWMYLPRGDAPGDSGVQPHHIAAGTGENSRTNEAVGNRPASEVAQDAAQGLAREVRSDLSDLLALVPPVEQTPAGMLLGSDMLGGEAGTPAPEVAAQVRDGLRPVAQTTFAAFTSLFGAAPRGKPSQPPSNSPPEGKTWPAGQGEL